MIAYEECTIGRLVNVYAKGLKVGVIVGYTRTGKVRVCKWSDNSRKWSSPQNMWDRQLFPIDLHELDARRRRICQAAHDNVRDAGGLVKYSGGAANAGGPPFMGAAREFSRAKGPVTKLAPVIAVAGKTEPTVIDPAKRQQIRKLNSKLGAFFGFNTGKVK